MFELRNRSPVPTSERILAADEMEPFAGKRSKSLALEQGARSVITHFDAFLAPGSRIPRWLSIPGLPGTGSTAAAPRTDINFRHGFDPPTAPPGGTRAWAGRPVMVLACSG